MRDPTTPAAALPQVGELGGACGREVQTTVVSAAQASRSSSVSAGRLIEWDPPQRKGRVQPTSWRLTPTVLPVPVDAPKPHRPPASSPAAVRRWPVPSVRARTRWWRDGRVLLRDEHRNSSSVGLSTETNRMPLSLQQVVVSKARLARAGTTPEP